MQRYPLVRQDMIWREEGEDALLFDPQTEELRVLNPTGLVVWQLCDGTRSIRDIADFLIQEFEVGDRAAVEDDLDAFFSDLQRRGLLTYLERGS